MAMPLRRVRPNRFFAKTDAIHSYSLPHPDVEWPPDRLQTGCVPDDDRALHALASCTCVVVPALSQLHRRHFFFATTSQCIVGHRHALAPLRRV
jgi:hypothetical protein